MSTWRCRPSQASKISKFWIGCIYKKRSPLVGPGLRRKVFLHTPKTLRTHRTIIFKNQPEPACCWGLGLHLGWIHGDFFDCLDCLVRVYEFCPSTVVEWFYMRHATRSLSKWIRLTFCDSYGLRVFPCSKITKIYLALICQCSIGPPKKHPQFVASFTASSWTGGSWCEPVLIRKLEQTKTAHQLVVNSNTSPTADPLQFCCTHILLPPSSIYRLPVNSFVTHLLPKQVSPTARILRLPVQMAADWDESTQNNGAVVYTYIYM